MKISYNWLKEYIDIDLPAAEVAELLTNTGLEVEGVEEVESVPGGLKDVVVGEVLTCVAHPNADRLKLTTVDLGEGDPVQIVCGAPNIAQGLKVPVAKVGAELHTDQGPFKIKKSKIRGEVSMGMICAEDELGLGESHAGVMELKPDTPVGTPAAQYFELESDVVFEIGLTPNRTDAISHYGVARDLRAALLRFGHAGAEFSLPSVAAFKVNNRELPFQIEIEAKKDCYRYLGLSLKGVKVEASPAWLQNRLRAIGIGPINNVVDVTNFVMQETGHPLHAFDADQIADHHIIVKRADEGQKFVTLDEKERSLSAEDMMIADTKKPLVLAGIFGGLKSGVNAETDKIFLESAHFNPVTVRKSAKRHALSTDSSFRYERGVDPEMTLYALKRAAMMIQDLAGGEISSEVKEARTKKIEPINVSLDLDRMDQLIGHKIEKEMVRDILNWLDIRIVAESAGSLNLEIPPYRHDVTREADVIEEILRIYGFNAVGIDQKMQISVAPRAQSGEARLRDKVTQALVASGYLEMINNSLTRQTYFESHGFDPDASVAMLNPLSQDLAVMRQNLLFGGLEAIAYNQKRQRSDLRFFEFGRQYQKTKKGFREENILALWVSGQERPENWRYPAENSDFYALKSDLLQQLSSLGIDRLTQVDEPHPFLDQSLELKHGKTTLARLGKVKESAQKLTDLKGASYYAEVYWDQAVKLADGVQIKMEDLPRFPEVRRDLALLLDQGVRYGDLQDAAFKAEKKLLKAVNLFDVYEGKNLPDGKKSYALSFTLQNREKTLTDKQVDQAMQRILKSFQNQFKAELR